MRRKRFVVWILIFVTLTGCTSGTIEVSNQVKVIEDSAELKKIEEELVIYNRENQRLQTLKETKKTLSLSDYLSDDMNKLIEYNSDLFDEYSIEAGLIEDKFNCLGTYLTGQKEMLSMDLEQANKGAEEEKSFSGNVKNFKIPIAFYFGTRTGVYSGCLTNGVPDGKGKFESTNPKGTTWIYEGEWKNGHFQGQGKTTWIDSENDIKDHHIGSYANDYMQGYGEYYSDGSLLYEGEYINGDMDSALDYQLSGVTDMPKSLQLDPTTKKYPEGAYTVGVDLPADTYMLIADDAGGSYSLTYESGQDYQLGQDIFDTETIVEVQDGETLKIEQGYAVALNKAPGLYPNEGWFADGLYLVGKHIKAGEYDLLCTSKEEGFYEILGDVHYNKIAECDTFKKKKHITLQDGQYLKLQDCKIQVGQSADEKKLAADKNSAASNEDMTIRFYFGDRSGAYTGELKNGLPDGTGTFQSINSAGIVWIYKGNFEKGHFQGQGKLSWDGLNEYYEGEFGNDYMQGQGKYYKNGKLAYEGRFCNGSENAGKTEQE